MGSAWTTAVVCLASQVVMASQSGGPADLAYAGTWKLNEARSDFGETTMTYTQNPSGQLQFTDSGNRSYAFQLDGKTYPSLFGYTSAWSQIDATTWETLVTDKGKLIVTVMTRLSADGKTLTTSAKGPKPTGGVFESTMAYTRVSGGPGLLGRWRTTDRPTGTPRVLALVPSGTDGLTIHLPDDREQCDAKFDGKDYPVTGPIANPGMTLAILKTGPRSFDMMENRVASRSSRCPSLSRTTARP